MRISGMIKIGAALGIDFIILYYLIDLRIAAAVTAAILFYAWVGQYTALMKDGAVKITGLNEYDRFKLTRAMHVLTADVRKKSAVNIRNVKLHVIPSDEINAYSYGRNHVAVTRGTLRAADELTLNAVLAHEISHSLCLDAMFHRIIFANVTIIMIAITIISFVATSFVWIIFLIMCLFGICGGIFSLFCVSGISKLTKGMFRLIQRIVLFIYQLAMGIVSRGCEYRADRYACMLGYGAQLKYFLESFAGEQDNRKKSLTELIYDSHPPTYKRIIKIRQNMKINQNTRINQSTKIRQNTKNKRNTKSNNTVVCAKRGGVYQ